MLILIIVHQQRTISLAGPTKSQEPTEGQRSVGKALWRDWDTLKETVGMKAGRRDTMAMEIQKTDGHVNYFVNIGVNCRNAERPKQFSNYYV